jgi:O-antigen/teichoic acid export membrane protein
MTWMTATTHELVQEGGAQPPAESPLQQPPAASASESAAKSARPLSSFGGTVARNVAWNWVGTATHMACGFVTVPYLLYHLGQEGYSLWTLIASLTGYFDLLDLGLRGSLGRNIALHEAREDRAGASAVFNTGLALLGAASLLVLAGTVGMLFLFTTLFDVPVTQVEETRLALGLIGVNLAFVFPFYAFEAILWAHQRFDLLNSVEIPAVLLRTALTFWLVTGQGGLVTLAVITLGVTLVSGAARVALGCRVAPWLRMRPAHVSRAAAAGLFGFGSWFVLVQVARVVTTRAGEPIIGNRLGVALVAPFTIASRLVGYANNVLISATGVLTPLATALHARGKHAQQQALFIQGGKCCLALALFFLVLFIFLGQPLLTLWTRGALPEAWPVLLTLALGEILPMSQWLTYSMVLGMGRHRLWAIMGLLEGGAVISLALTVGQAHGLVGVAVAIAIPGALCRGLVPLLYACRLVGVSVLRYTWQALLPGAVIVVPAAACLALLNRWQGADTWLRLVAQCVAAGFCFLAAGAVVLVPWAGRRALSLASSRACPGGPDDASGSEP